MRLIGCHRSCIRVLHPGSTERGSGGRQTGCAGAFYSRGGAALAGGPGGGGVQGGVHSQETGSLSGRGINGRS